MELPPSVPRTLPPLHQQQKNPSSSQAFAAAAPSSLPRLAIIPKTKWVPDESQTACHICNERFHALKRKHHCRACGEVICNNCCLHHRTMGRTVRVCVPCLAFRSLDSP